MTTLKPGVVRIFEDGAVTPVFVRGGFADVTPAGFTILAEEAIRLSEVNAADLDAKIANARADANDPGNEVRRKAGGDQLAYLEAIKAAL